MENDDITKEKEHYSMLAIKSLESFLKSSSVEDIKKMIESISEFKKHLESCKKRDDEIQLEINAEWNNLTDEEKERRNKITHKLMELTGMSKLEIENFGETNLGKSYKDNKY
jgi:hypothetical protein